MASPKSATQPKREWSFSFTADDLPSSGKTLTLSPNENERVAIAERAGLVSLDACTVDFTLNREQGHIIHVTGKLKAKVTQSCVVTMEDVEAPLEDDFEAWYSDPERTILFKKAQHEALSKLEIGDLPMLEESDDPEPLEQGKIDLGELAVQYLCLAVEPYPVKPGVTRSEIITTEKDDQPAKELKPNPFAALKNWRPKD